LPNKAERFFYKDRFVDGLYAHSYLPRSPKISSISMEGQEIQVYGNAVRFISSSKSIHQTVEAGDGEPKREKSTLHDISRRYPYDIKLSGGSITFNRSSKEDAYRFRIYYQRREITTTTNSKDPVSGFRIRFKKNVNSSTKEEITRVKEAHQGDTVETSDFNPPSRQDNRNNNINVSSNVSSTFSCQRATDCQELLSETIEKKLEFHAKYNKSDEIGTRKVVHSGNRMERRCDHATPSSRRHDLYGCFNDWLGSKDERRELLRKVEQSPEAESYQRFGTYCNLFSNIQMARDSPEQASPDQIRQHGICSTSEQDGRCSIKGPLANIKKNLELMPAKTNKTQSLLYSRKGQQRSRHVVTKKRSPRLESQGEDIQFDSFNLESSYSRLIRRLREQENAQVLQLGSRLKSFRTRRDVNILERQGSIIRKSAMDLTAESSKQDRKRTSRDNPDHTLLEDGILVSSDTTVSSGFPKVITASSSKHRYRKIRLGSRAIGQQALSNRMEAIRSTLKKQGLSDKAISLIQASTAASTNRAYNSIWRAWYRWCQQRKVNIVEATVTEITNFLAELFESHGQAYVSLARSALASWFNLVLDNSLSSYEPIKRLLKGTFNLDPPKPRYLEMFDIQKVFTFIKDNWQDNNNLSLNDLTAKTAFLLASSALLRSSDLARISSHSIKISQDSLSFIVRSPKERTIKRPHKIVNLQSSSDQSLCPVLATTCYLQRTSQRSLHDSLFVHKFLLPASKDKIAKWLSYVLERSGIDSSFKPHSIRSASATHLINLGTPIDKVLALGNWTSRSVFTKFYDRSSSTKKQ